MKKIICREASGEKKLKTFAEKHLEKKPPKKIFAEKGGGKN